MKINALSLLFFDEYFFGEIDERTNVKTVSDDVIYLFEKNNFHEYVSLNNWNISVDEIKNNFDEASYVMKIQNVINNFDDFHNFSVIISGKDHQFSIYISFRDNFDLFVINTGLAADFHGYSSEYEYVNGLIHLRVGREDKENIINFSNELINFLTSDITQNCSDFYLNVLPLLTTTVADSLPLELQQSSSCSPTCVKYMLPMMIVKGKNNFKAVRDQIIFWLMCYFFIDNHQHVFQSCREYTEIFRLKFLYMKERVKHDGIPVDEVQKIFFSYYKSIKPYDYMKQLKSKPDKIIISEKKFDKIPSTDNIYYFAERMVDGYYHRFTLITMLHYFKKHMSNDLFDYYHQTAKKLKNYYVEGGNGKKLLSRYNGKSIKHLLTAFDEFSDNVEYIPPNNESFIYYCIFLCIKNKKVPQKVFSFNHPLVTCLKALVYEKWDDKLLQFMGDKDCSFIVYRLINKLPIREFNCFNFIILNEDGSVSLNYSDKKVIFEMVKPCGTLYEDMLTGYNFIGNDFSFTKGNEIMFMKNKHIKIKDASFINDYKIINPPKEVENYLKFMKYIIVVERDDKHYLCFHGKTKLYEEHGTPEEKFFKKALAISTPNEFTFAFAFADKLFFMEITNGRVWHLDEAFVVYYYNWCLSCSCFNAIYLTNIASHIKLNDIVRHISHPYLPYMYARMGERYNKDIYFASGYYPKYMCSNNRKLYHSHYRYNNEIIFNKKPNEVVEKHVTIPFLKNDGELAMIMERPTDPFDEPIHLKNNFITVSNINMKSIARTSIAFDNVIIICSEDKLENYYNDLVIYSSRVCNCQVIKNNLVTHSNIKIINIVSDVYIKHYVSAGYFLHDNMLFVLDANELLNNNTSDLIIKNANGKKIKQISMIDVLSSYVSKNKICVSSGANIIEIIDYKHSLRMNVREENVEGMRYNYYNQLLISVDRSINDTPFFYDPRPAIERFKNANMGSDFFRKIYDEAVRYKQQKSTPQYKFQERFYGDIFSPFINENYRCVPSVFHYIGTRKYNEYICCYSFCDDTKKLIISPTFFQDMIFSDNVNDYYFLVTDDKNLLITRYELNQLGNYILNGQVYPLKKMTHCLRDMHIYSLLLGHKTKENVEAFNKYYEEVDDDTKKYAQLIKNYI